MALDLGNQGVLARTGVAEEPVKFYRQDDGTFIAEFETAMSKPGRDPFRALTDLQAILDAVGAGRIPKREDSRKQGEKPPALVEQRPQPPPAPPPIFPRENYADLAVQCLRCGFTTHHPLAGPVVPAIKFPAGGEEPPLPPYSGQKCKCAACGYGHGRPPYSTRPVDLFATHHRRVPSQRSHLLRICPRCGYGWKEACVGEGGDT